MQELRRMFLEEKERQVTLIVSVFLEGGGRRGVEGGRGGGTHFRNGRGRMVMDPGRVYSV